MTINNCVNIATATGTPSLTTYNEFVSWTPVITGSTVAGAGTYTLQFGRYTQIGKAVFIDCEITWTAHTGTGNMLLTGLPLTVRNVASYVPLAHINTSDINFPAGTIQINGEFTLNTTQMALVTTRDNNTNLSVAMDASGTLKMSGFYITT